jgi:hypothetical protein
LSTGKPVWDTSGNVGIGTSNPAQSLDVVGNIIGSQSVTIGGGGLYQAGSIYSDANFGVIFRARQASPVVAQMRWAAADNTAMMDITNRLALYGIASRGTSGFAVASTNDSVGGLVRQSGYIEIVTDVGAVGVNYFLSDERKKENITPCEKTSSDLIKDINFIQFDWKEGSGNTGHVDVGVSAQQLQSLDNRLVNELSDGSLMVNEPALVTHLAKALQEQQAIITELKTRIEALEQA